MGQVCKINNQEKKMLRLIKIAAQIVFIEDKKLFEELAKKWK